VPGVADHQLEVIVVIDGGADVGVIILELGEGHLSVHLASHVKGFQELEQDFFGLLLSAFNIWMLAGVIDPDDVIEMQLTTPILVNLLEGEVD
jgi:hypothetical protein